MGQLEEAFDGNNCKGNAASRLPSHLLPAAASVSSIL